jgi:streptogramin lyase
MNNKKSIPDVLKTIKMLSPKTVIQMNAYARLILIFCCIVSSPSAFAQGEAIGQWRSHLPYNNVVSAATDGNKLFVAGKSSFFSYDISKDEIQTYSKVNGMSDIELSYIAYDNVTQMAVLAYTNSNIDLFKDETFYNIPELKLRSVSGNKSIYNVFIDEGLAYLSTGVGVLVINLQKKEIKENYVFSKNKNNYAVKSMSGNGSFLYAATDIGLYRTTKNNPNIQATATWKLIDSSRKYVNTTLALNKTFLSTIDSVFVLENDTPVFVYSLDSSIIYHIDPVENGLSISTFSSRKFSGEIFILDKDYKQVDSLESARPLMTTQTLDKRVWISDLSWGLRCKDNSIIPNGPNNIGCYDIVADKGNLYVAHGSYDDRWNIRLNPSGFSTFEENKWKGYDVYTLPEFVRLRDAVRLAKDPVDNSLYIASLTDGLYHLKSDKTGENLRETVFEQNILDPTTYRISGVAFDQGNNLWVTQNNAPNELMARSSKDGNWYKFSLPATRPRPYWENGAAGLIIDNYNQKWFFSPAGGGVLVYNDHNTLENPSDDTYTKLLIGKGYGNLPDNFVQCLASDKKGAIWIGTSNGIGIHNCPENITEPGNSCETEIRVVQYDQFAGQLFAGESVNSIAVDGANRKWIGTGNGVWLISEDANKIITRFTKDNSPLPSNNIQKIAVDPKTGDVYFGTDKGMVSYRGTSTNGDEGNKDVLIFPNPVKGDYNGTIAIKGLVENADVRITDISGQLIYRTKALGGQAVWNGTDYTGRRPQTGVFLVFASNSLGTETYVGKMVFIK